MSHNGASRPWRLLLAVAALSAIGTHGLCFMPQMAPAPLAPHDGGRASWKDAPPACGMDADDDAVSGILAGQQFEPAPIVVVTSISPAVDRARPAADGYVAVQSCHSPPIVRVLRI